MGGGPSKASCAVNRRALLNISNARDIITECSKHKIAYAWGIVVVFVVVLIVAHLLTSKYEHDDMPRKHLYVPLWLVFVPILFGIMYTMRIRDMDLHSFRSEELEYALSEMGKKEYLQYRANDDRAAKSLLGTATSSSVLATANILGPFLRGDR